jgi:hypothetical protein
MTTATEPAWRSLQRKSRWFSALDRGAADTKRIDTFTWLVDVRTEITLRFRGRERAWANTSYVEFLKSAGALKELGTFSSVMNEPPCVLFKKHR